MFKFLSPLKSRSNVRGNRVNLWERTGRELNRVSWSGRILIRVKHGLGPEGSDSSLLDS